MKTQHEIEKMKDEVKKQLNDHEIKMISGDHDEELVFMSAKKHKLQAQYNILLEVLK